ncbi:DUF2147 domain-containing protein [Sansalvadorimonas sp. 2012CJ34-2]|uniref:DUF2147 domain-containing protein n=1 Tax=Parendozoicomonas callyspongiae TaxID=2942213 RepID=A0ABT0PKC6_9GAMM|nr:DUF2147 domain-containing protein [Sansalvadorimonas sp. 2012CJ34-2]MCL6271830.1 DUF2147 domain-containing protein [Sansalvadorimonas sp. 2012CJ34-2]
MMKKYIRPFGRSGLALALFIARVGPALAVEAPALDVSPAGLWTTLDDKSHKPVSQVRIWRDNDNWYGKVERIYDDNSRGDACKRCKGDKKNQPVEGMTILWDMKQDGGVFDKGKILDPGNGKTYSASMKLLGNGNQLEVRGYIGISAIGRSQVWERIDEAESKTL